MKLFCQSVGMTTGEVKLWHDRRTFHHSVFDPADLVERKDGQRISVVLPALNEAATVGAIVSVIRTELMDRIPLVDELVVIDPGSTDGTADVAAAAGAKVIAEAEILPSLGRIPGKGEALWKSLAATTGDIVCWLDADIENPSAAFAYGLLGPLLTDPAVHYVKGCYDRPGGGGRVTELVARPLINLHWPLLAGLAQPLSGEYAGRRAVLEQVPFVSGYGVELGLLIDLLDLVGLDGLAQVDLDRRVHRNQDPQALGRMSFAILQTALTRLQRERRMTLAEPPNPTLVQFRNGRMTEAEVVVVERPPMRTVRPA